MSHITVPELTLWQRNGLPFKSIDVRRAKARDASGRAIEDADCLDPAAWLDWKDQTPKDRPVVLYCAYGHEIGRGLAEPCAPWAGTPATSLADSKAGSHQVTRSSSCRNRKQYLDAPNPNLPAAQ